MADNVIINVKGEEPIDKKPYFSQYNEDANLHIYDKDERYVTVQIIDKDNKSISIDVPKSVLNLIIK